MKNFKKVLALVLAVATVFSFTAMANAAEVAYGELTDTTSVTHVEAVKVLTGLGVIQGYEDKTFRPNDNVTRVQMAKMVGYIMNDAEDVNDLYKAACTFADSKTNWGAGYIAYCATQGIVSGKSANVFDPNANVTGVQAAKMLLCALGYDASAEGFTGDGWDANVLKVAKKAGLLNDLSQNKMGAALNREDAAQMIFNALCANPVEYDDKGMTISINGAVISSGASKAEAMTKLVGGQYVVYPWYEDHFCEKDGHLYLTKSTEAVNDFGLLTVSWMYGEDKDGAYTSIADNIELEKIFTNKVSAKDLFNLFGKLGTNDEITFALDGVEKTPFTKEYVANVSGNDKKEFKADTIEVYLTEDTNTQGETTRLIQVIGKNYYVGLITGHKDAKNDDAEYITVKGKTAGKSGTFETTAFSAADKGETYVVYNYANGTIYDLKKVVKTESGAVTRVSSTTKNSVTTYTVYADGKTYTTSAACNTIPAKDAYYDLYLDPNGNIAYAEETEAANKAYFMVVSKAMSESQSLDNDGTDFKVRLLGTDGKTIDLGVSKINGYDVNAMNFGALERMNATNEDTEIGDCYIGNIVTYKLDTDGKAKIQIEDDHQSGGNGATVTKDAANLATWFTGTAVNNKTNFVIITLDSDNKFVYTPILGLSAAKAVVENYAFYDFNYVTEKVDATNPASADYTATIFAFADVLGNVSTKTVFYKGAGVEEVIVDDEAYVKTWALVGTEVSEVYVEAEVYAELDYGYTVASSYKTDAETGYVIGISEDGYYNKKADVDTLSYYAGQLTIANLAVESADIPVMIFNVADEEFVEEFVSSVADEPAEYITNTELTYIVTSTTDNTVKYIYAINNDNPI